MILKLFITYIYIPHDDLFDKICCLLDIVFDEKCVNLIKVNENLKRVPWCQGFKLGGYCFSRNEVKEISKYLQGNISDKYKGNANRQIIGAPMGCDCAPF